MKKLLIILFGIAIINISYGYDMSDPNPTIDIELLKTMNSTQKECVLSHGCTIPTPEIVARMNDTRESLREEDILNKQCLKGAMNDCGVGVALPMNDSIEIKMPEMDLSHDMFE